MAFIHPKQHPDLNLPALGSIVSVRTIDTTLDMFCKTLPFLSPVIQGHEFINFPTLAFLIENKALGKRVLFVESFMAGMRVEKGVDELLVEAGIELESVDSIIRRLVSKKSHLKLAIG
jgi:hypothetical protein